MIERTFSTNSNSNAIRISHKPKDLNDPLRAVGFCHRLKRWSADRYNHIETGRHHLLGNGVGDGEITVGVEPFYANVLSVDQAVCGETVKHSRDSFLQRRLGRVLDDC